MGDRGIAGRATAARPPTALRCGLLLFATRASLKVWGFAAVTKWITKRVEHIGPTVPAETDYVRSVERAVALAGALYPGRARCLEQSLVLYYLLRRQGIAARYCQGVMAYPFGAHAWVECHGEVLNDVAEHVARFARLPAQLP